MNKPLLGFATALLMATSVTACAPEPSHKAGVTDPPAAGSPTPSAPTTPTPPSDAEPESTLIPGCEELVPMEVAHTKLESHFQFIGDDPTTQDRMIASLGPAAQRALGNATQTSYCLWAIPNSDGHSSLIIAELPAPAREDFLAELRASDFTEAEMNGSPTFVWESNVRIGSRFIWYGFTDNLLVASLALEPDGDIGGPALEALACRGRESRNSDGCIAEG